jgi:ribosomal protein S17
MAIGGNTKSLKKTSRCIGESGRNMKQIIGFATKFYTLWHYEAIPQYRTDSYGTHHQIGVQHNYYYCKNISTDLDKVKSLYPNVAIDKGLKGTTSFTENEKLDLPNNYFWAGKYAGRLIDEIMVSDFQYCLWSASNYGGKTSEYIEAHPIYLAHFEAIEKAKQTKIENAQTVKVGDIVELEFTRNGFNPWYSDGGKIDRIDSTDEYPASMYDRCITEAKLGDTVITVQCSGAKYVGGMYPYIMPSIDGKVQKTKGKNITVKVLEVLNTTVYGNIVHQQIKIA